MTLSIVKKLKEPLGDPEREIHRLRRATGCQQRNESLAIAGRNLFDNEASSSANSGPKPIPPLKSLQEHLSPSLAGFQNPFVLPIEQTGNIVDSRDIWLIQCICTFQGLKGENPIHHVKHFLSLVDNIQADGAMRDASRLRFFHFTLKGKAKKSLNRIPPSQITTWEQLVSKFLDKFFPPEPLHHGVNKWILVQIFYYNVSPDDRNGIDHFTQYRFNQLNEDEGWNRIEEYVQYQDNTWEEPALGIEVVLEEMIKISANVVQRNAFFSK
ncbi:hypothetical protein Tco_0505131 [Tanacetum coccineum]